MQGTPVDTPQSPAGFSQPSPGFVRRVIAGSLAALGLAAAFVAVVTFAMGALYLVVEWPAYPTLARDVYDRSMVDSVLRLWFFSFTACLALVFASLLGFWEIAPSRVHEARDASHTRLDHAALLSAILASIVLIAAAAPSYVPRPGATIVFADAEFPTAIPGPAIWGTFNVTWRISGPIHEEAGWFLDGAFYVQWKEWPGYREQASTGIAALDPNGTRIVPSDSLYEYVVPRTGEYVVILAVPAEPGFCYPDVCPDINWTAGHVSGTLTMANPTAYPPVQTLLELMGVASAAAGVGLTILGIRRRKRPPLVGLANRVVSRFP